PTIGLTRQPAGYLLRGNLNKLELPKTIFGQTYSILCSGERYGPLSPYLDDDKL
ncbi:hypothetical protein L9F63_022240, partial [Diploptera punctata]